MRVSFHKQYVKAFRKLNNKEKVKTSEALRLFQENPKNPMLNNHALKGDMKGRYSISVGGDLRLVFEKEGNYVKVLFLQVGSHNQVY